MAPQIHIPHVGTLFWSIDKLHIAGSPHWDWLRKKTIIKCIEPACHVFKGHALHLAPGYGSKLKMTLPPSFDLGLLQTLQDEAPGTYSATLIEIAFDIYARSVGDAKSIICWLVRHVRKRNHQRDYLDWAFAPYEEPPEGLLRLPTIYFENAKSTVRLKIYARHEKRHQKQFADQIIVRLEWTIKDKDAIVRHLGGNEIDDLTPPDIGRFLQRNLHLEKIDYSEFGKLRFPDQVGCFYQLGRNRLSQHCRAEIGARRLMRVFACRDKRFRNGVETQENHEMALLISQNPSYAVGYLKNTRDSSGNPIFSDYHIKKCIRPVKITKRLRKRVA